MLFGKDCKIRKCNSNKYGKTYNTGINCSPIARILFLCGVPSGQKVLSKFSIPKWIFLEKKYFKRFCTRLFSCEGSIIKEEGRRPRIRLEMWKAENLVKDGLNFMEDISAGLKKYFNIESSIHLRNLKNTRKDGIITKPIRLTILTNSVMAFYKKIGFEGDKQKSLKALIRR